MAQRAHHGAESGEEGVLGQLLPRRFGDAEVDHFGHRLAIVQRHQNIGRLDVAVDDAFLMRVLNRLADGDEQLSSAAATTAIGRCSGWATL
jgi:hypothetical protein